MPGPSVSRAIYYRLIRWAFTRFYREFAWTYDSVAALVSAGNWRSWILAVVPYLRGSVLELGCGTGNLQQALAMREASPDPVGVDISPQMLHLARRKMERSNALARLVQSDARGLPFRSGSFDTIVATFPSEYIVEHATLSEARRVLRAGGHLVIVPVAQFTTDGLYERVMDIAYRVTLQQSPRSVRKTRSPDDAMPAQVEIQSQYSAPQAAQLPAIQFGGALSRAGFQVQEQWVAAPGGKVYLAIGEAIVCPQPLTKN
jgi:ubiquinone/menaquinone biosynthesis C-methylase UbiE